MKLLLSEEIGFCYGVKRAVGIVDKLSTTHKVKTFGPLIHNPQMIEKLIAKGVDIADKVIKDNCKLVIRSHGVGPEIYESLEANGVNYVDATCPFVKNAQNFVKAKDRENVPIIIFGDKSHPEVKAVMSYAKNVMVVESIDQIDKLPNFEKVAVVSQTTQSKRLFQKVILLLLDKASEVDVYNSICGATEKRQEEAARLAKIVDIMIIVGGKNSANTKRLKMVCSDYCDKCRHIETVDELKAEWFGKNSIAGLVTGASTPDFIVDDIIERLNLWFGRDLSIECLN